MNITDFLKMLGDARSQEEAHDLIVNHLEEAEASLDRVRKALQAAIEAAAHGGIDELTSGAPGAKVKHEDR
jgi:hypothetical protein